MVEDRKEPQPTVEVREAVVFHSILKAVVHQDRAIQAAHHRDRQDQVAVEQGPQVLVLLAQLVEQVEPAIVHPS